MVLYIWQLMPVTANIGAPMCLLLLFSSAPSIGGGNSNLLIHGIDELGQVVRHIVHLDMPGELQGTLAEGIDDGVGSGRSLEVRQVIVGVSVMKHLVDVVQVHQNPALAVIEVSGWVLTEHPVSIHIVDGYLPVVLIQHGQHRKINEVVINIEHGIVKGPVAGEHVLGDVLPPINQVSAARMGHQ